VTPLPVSVAWAVLLAAVLPGQDLPPEASLLVCVKEHGRATFERIPDYACLETVDRFAACELPSTPYDVDLPSDMNVRDIATTIAYAHTRIGSSKQPAVRVRPAAPPFSLELLHCLESHRA